MSHSELDRFGQRMIAQLGPNYQSSSLVRSLGVNSSGGQMFRVEIDPNAPFPESNSVTFGPMHNNAHYGRNYDKVTKVVAIYDYTNHVDGDVCFHKGDIMILLDYNNSEWWYVRHPKNGVGYAPRNFVARLESLESEEWYAGKIQRSQAEKLVFANNLPRGTFLVRKRDLNNEYALTINDCHGGSIEVKHYKIRPMDGGNGFFITTKKIFPTIRDLVHYYSSELRH